MNETSRSDDKEASDLQNGGELQTDRAAAQSTILRWIKASSRFPGLPKLRAWRERRRERELINRMTASGFWNVDWYLASNPDVRQAGLDPLTHFIRHGAREGRDPSPLFKNPRPIPASRVFILLDLRRSIHRISDRNTM